MMQLLASGPSPYVRKVDMTARMKGLAGQVEIVARDDPKLATLRARNPLGKIPVLLRDDGSCLFDSHVICEYLDALAPMPALFPRDGDARWRTLTLAALGDGMLDAALLLVYEVRYRSEDQRVQDWIDRQRSKLDRALSVLETSPPDWSTHPDYGHLTIASALGYLDFRHGGVWRDQHPKLVQWLERFAAAVPAYAQTMPAD